VVDDRYRAAPFFSLARAAWIPYALTWDTGALRGVGPRTIPLSDITITWPRRNDFEGDERRPALVLTGKPLAQHLAWIARSRAGLLEISPDQDVFDATAAELQLTGFSEVLRALGDADHHDAQTDFAALFAFLAETAQMISAGLNATTDADARLNDATVTLGTPATEAAR
jgi:hypothetical protein